jgi:hypothetical protein
MSAELFFENQATKRRYKIVSFDKEAGTVTLIGPHNLPFTEKFSKERFQQMGYTLVQEAAAPAPPAPPPPPTDTMVVA